LNSEQRQIEAVANDAITRYHLQALIVRVTTDGKDTYTRATGDSMTGVPATTDMLVRNGFVAYMYLTTMLLQFVDQKKISLDDKLSKYRPDLPEANAVTIKMLANSTSGYADYVYQSALENGIYTNPFRQWTSAELIKIGTSAPPDFAPGTNWEYAHTNYAILGTVLQKVGGKPLDQLMQQYIFQPMGLKHTVSSDTPQIPDPVLHTFSSERREPLGIKAGVPFYEDTTFWNPSWTVPQGASQASDIADLTTSIVAIGSGKLLSPASHQAQVGPNLIGFGHKAAGCPACNQNTAKISFGMATVLQGPWITGNKLFAGSGAIVGYLPQKKIAIAIITTYTPAGFDSQGNVKDSGPAILKAMSKAVAPETPIP
jgi:CubicO group peptidase (beta-lactamase class C family)